MLLFEDNIFIEILRSSLTLGTTTGGIALDTLVQQLTSIHLQGCGDTTSSLGNQINTIVGGEFNECTTICGTTSSHFCAKSSVSDIDIYNKKPYDVAERKAKQIYDKYDQNHVKALDDGASLITSNSEVSQLIDDIISSTTSKEELLNNLEALKTILSQEDNAKEKPKIKNKVRNKEHETNKK